MEAKHHIFQQPTIKVKMSRAIRLSLLLTFLLAAGTLAAQTTASSIRSFTDQLGDEAIIRMAGDDYSVTYNHRISGSMHSISTPSPQNMSILVLSRWLEIFATKHLLRTIKIF